MLYKQLWNIEFIFWVFIPIVFVCGCCALVNYSWKQLLEHKDKIYKYKAESFRNPINTSVTVTALIVPLISGLIAYLLKSTPTPPIEELFPLIASLLIFLLVIMSGLWLLYSIATQSPDDDSFTIKKNRNSKLPGLFVAQLCLLFVGILLIVFFLLKLDLSSVKQKNTQEQQIKNEEVQR